ncbi:ribonuclease P-related protein [Pyrolobus fumarii 1A]|uniref:Ribonuclease P protein component 2 n=1 Tax=Pyrolobus fumarii (strain DSM 11204 / 1A) TaxID=694429 RepID=G0EDS7_PYRF1|nr:Rpp14/Pop5 family protein [Pyrolobus fumarii]AEM38696.1 ribonuclease P-related protein [Pyrolobus fumarii 1A]
MATSTQVTLLVSLASLISAAIAIAALLIARNTSRSLARVERTTREAISRISKLEAIVAKTVQVIDDIEEARKLKRRRRRRYVAALILYEDRLPPDPRVVQTAIEEGLRRLGGELAVAEARPTIVYYDPVRGAVIIRTNHLAVNLVLAGLLLVNRIGGTRVHIVPLRTAGTIQSARRYLGILEKLPARAG